MSGWELPRRCSSGRLSARSARVHSSAAGDLTCGDAGGRLRSGLAQCAAFLPLLPRDVPVAEPVGWFELRGGVVDRDDVAVAEVVVEPPAGLGAEVDAAVGDVAAALVGDRPWGGGDENAAVGHAHRERDLLVVAERGVRRQAVAVRVHPLYLVLLLRHIGAARRDERDLLAV